MPHQLPIYVYAICLCLGLCQACKPSPSLVSKQSQRALDEDFPAHLVAEEGIPENIVIPEEVPEADPEPDTASEDAADPNAPPDWKARYQELNTAYIAAFVPPPVGKTVKLAMVTGQIQEGQLVAVGNQGLTLAVSSGEIEIQRTALAMTMRVRLFAEDYAHEKAIRTVKLEKRKFDLAQQQNQQTAAAAAARDAAQAREHEVRVVAARTVLPVNDPQDGSVPAVKDYIEKNTRNAGTVKYLQWWKVIPKDGRYIVRCRYQADGGNLGQLTLDQYFFMNAKGRVYQTANYKGQ